MLLKVGDIIQAGDEYYGTNIDHRYDRDWRCAKNFIGETITDNTKPFRRVIPQSHGYKPVPDIINTTLPDKAGFYWVKAGQLNTWQIAEVIGTAPFCRIVLHDEWNTKIYLLTDNTIKEWGPRFERYGGKK